MNVAYGSIDTPIGTFWAASGDQGLVRAGLDDDGGSFARRLMFDHYAPHFEPGELTDVLTQIEDYFGGKRPSFEAAVDLRRFTLFQQMVLRAVAKVPYGEVRSYRDIAKTIGKPLAARAVGGAIAANAISIVIPCHRIVKSDGTVGYYATGAEPDRGVPRKRELLALEGVVPGKGLAI